MKNSANGRNQGTHTDALVMLMWEQHEDEIKIFEELSLKLCVSRTQDEDVS